MRLTDRVDVLDPTWVTDPYSGEQTADWTNPVTVAANVPAEVAYTTVSLMTADGRNALVEELRAVLPPGTLDDGNRLRWRGNVYVNDGPVMVRRRNGADHHVTVPIKLVTG